MEKATILVQLDTDPLPSVFDRVVAVDAGVQHTFSYGGVTPQNVMPLVHGCIFTRGGKDLARTAIFVGGSDVTAGEAVLAEVKKHLIPQYGLSVSLMLDSNGANTTAAAAVRAAGRHLDLSKTKALVLGGTGPVGQRVARLLAKAGGHVRLGSRQKSRAEAVCEAIRAHIPGGHLEAVSVASSSDAPAALDGRTLVVAAGAAGAVLLPKRLRRGCESLKVAIDLNGVPPSGIEGVELGDKGADRDGHICYGALGVGGTKMKVHRAAIGKLFEANNAVLDVEEVYALALQLP
ncbi:NADP-dependent methylenetetrahydromethanopterin/methylenetetrahydrofolate dehydrogenase [Gemmata sp. JC673]|uniref:NADP-dependent methylenetetrahydromethanopterin/methylenetetrahydrofolate dehydrogenase n=1 Tax=Gemmata algarum TaxID=2975278 RepID=A0ABU5F7S9_9BACT|nr:NADP-dependent methylenetetrahydromethanopterin/methylenetetrahydrofolate dehydrogenase [Gemmata algarum]MDY3562393.1 NADP-dependent methylenetetrahydromethanopterin/methylenetetrahydrofolate dehydrogenase [Gemmata algarum]